MLQAFAGGPLPEMEDKERSESLANDFWTTMIAARSPLGEYSDGDGSKIATALAFERLTDDRDAPRINSLRASSIWLQRVSNVARGRCFVITEKGHFGLVHRYVNVGDEVCILMGCSVPVILRKFRGEERFFLGDAYIQGWMEGEMIKEWGGEEEIEKTVTMKKFRKWLDDRESMPKGDEEWKPFILV
jgi:hypothetical protein